MRALFSDHRPAQAFLLHAVRRQGALPPLRRKETETGGREMRGATGIIIRHSRTCATQADKQARCNCRPSYRAEVYDKRSKQKLRKTFSNLDEAKGWRHDTAAALRRGPIGKPTKTTTREAA